MDTFEERVKEIEFEVQAVRRSISRILRLASEMEENYRAMKGLYENTIEDIEQELSKREQPPIGTDNRGPC